MTHALGWNYAQSIRVRKVGFPTVHHEADFKISSGLGETIRLGLRLSRIGNRSFDLQYRVFGSDSDVVRAIARATCATVDLEPEPENVAAIAIPSELRQKMQAFGVSSW